MNQVEMHNVRVNCPSFHVNTLELSKVLYSLVVKILDLLRMLLPIQSEILL